MEIKYYIREITDKKFWHDSLNEFDDANIYQTWNFAVYAQKEKNVRHLAILENHNVIGLAQVRIRVLPVLNKGIAYIFNGPLWQKKNHENKIEKMFEIINALKEEFVINQRLVLRIKPYMYTDEAEQFNLNSKYSSILEDEKMTYRTLVLYLSKSEDELRAGLKRRWRRYLNKAERNGLEVIDGNNSILYKDFIDIYNQMMMRKKFKEHVNPVLMGEMNKKLDEELKLKIFIAYKDKVPIASLVGSAIGKTGIGLLGGINELGMKLYGSYLLQWEMIRWFKSIGCYRYDLGGINPERNPDTYFFKTGISETEVQRIGVYEKSEDKISKLIITFAEKFREK